MLGNFFLLHNTETRYQTGILFWNFTHSSEDDSDITLLGILEIAGTSYKNNKN